MEDLQYPGFSPEQIAYLSLVFTPSTISPDTPLTKIMYEAGASSVVNHIKVQEQFHQQ